MTFITIVYHINNVKYVKTKKTNCQITNNINMKNLLIDKIRDTVFKSILIDTTDVKVTFKGISRT